MDPRHLTTDQLIAAAMSKFRAERGRRSIFAGGRKVETRTAGEKVLYLPNGRHVRVSVDDSGVATQVEEDHSLHAIVRPKPIVLRIRPDRALAAASGQARPQPIRAVTSIPRRNP